MYKILIVDDDDGLRILFGKRFALAGYAVLYAGDGEEGLQIAEAELPDVIILDFQMPLMNGSDMLGQLRATSWGETMPVVFVTAATTIDVIHNLELADIVFKNPLPLEN